MSQNQNFPTPGSGSYPGEPVHADHAAAVPAVPGSSPVADRPDVVRNPDSHFPSPHSDTSGNAYPVQAQPPEPPPWTDEDFVEYARARYGYKFTPAAARAFATYDPESRDIQAAEFYRFRDEQYDMFGYF